MFVLKIIVLIPHKIPFSASRPLLEPIFALTGSNKKSHTFPTRRNKCGFYIFALSMVQIICPCISIHMRLLKPLILSKFHLFYYNWHGKFSLTRY